MDRLKVEIRFLVSKMYSDRANFYQRQILRAAKSKNSSFKSSKHGTSRDLTTLCHSAAISYQWIVNFKRVPCLYDNVHISHFISKPMTAILTLCYLTTRSQIWQITFCHRSVSVTKWLQGSRFTRFLAFLTAAVFERALLIYDHTQRRHVNQSGGYLIKARSRPAA